MRLFVAVDIPEEVRSAVNALLARLRPQCTGARWARMEGLHVTLKFIGEMLPEKLEAIQQSLAAVSFPKAIAMDFRGLGFFPNERRPRVLWVGIEAGPGLASLATAVDAALVPLGVPREERAFSPHLTLARFDMSRGLGHLRSAIEAAGPLAFGRANAGEFQLYQSVLKRGGAEYTRVASFACAENES